MDIIDVARNCILRMLRIDFDGSRVVVGPDETYQLVTNLNLDHPGVMAIGGRSIRELADIAADWLETEMRRPILRQEWIRDEFTRTRWILADTIETLMVSDSGNEKHREGIGPPDSTTQVPEPSSNTPL
jgi:hypothetical protein